MLWHWAQESRALATGKKPRGLLRFLVSQTSALGHAGSIKKEILNIAAEGTVPSCKGGSSGLVPAEKGSSEYPLEKLPGQSYAMELRSGELSGRVKEREKGKRSHR